MTEFSPALITKAKALFEANMGSGPMSYTWDQLSVDQQSAWITLAQGQLEGITRATSIAG